MKQLNPNPIGHFYSDGLVIEQQIALLQSAVSHFEKKLSPNTKQNIYFYLQTNYLTAEINVFFINNEVLKSISACIA